MTQEQQDLLWSVLSKEQRDFERLKISIPPNDKYQRGYDEAYTEIFGYHNLTSDTEPSELLFVERKQVQEYFNESKHIAGTTHDEETRIKHSVRVNLLGTLFGDNVLPDKPIEEKAKEIVDTIKDDIDNPIQMPETMLMSKPKFKVGDKVISKADNNIVCIVEYQSPITGLYQLDIGGRAVIHRSEECLASYTEENKHDMITTENGDLPPCSTISDEELDEIIATLTAIRDRRKEDNSKLTEILSKLKPI